MKWYGVILIAIIIETVTELIKQWFPKFIEKEWRIRVFTMVLGIATCFVYDADIFVTLNIPGKIPYLGIIITGILTAGGSNIIFDVINRIKDHFDDAGIEG